MLHESEARDFEKMTDLVPTPNAFPGKTQRDIGAKSREDLLDVCSGCRPGDGPRRDKCSIDLRSARQKVSIASPPSPLFLTLQNRKDGSSIPLESAENKVITTRSHLTFAVRECVEQMHRGGHFLFEHSSNASWNEQCIEKFIAQPRVFRIERPMCRWHLRVCAQEMACKRFWS